MERRRVGTVVVVLTALLCGCAGSSPTSPSAGTPSAGASAPLLRLVNVGAVSISGLVVIFPDERLEFGDVPAGTSTVYRPVSRGVYRYAAYQARLGDRIVSQPVIDWVGELPMRGEAFTYTIEASEGPASGITIRLLAATHDQ